MPGERPDRPDLTDVMSAFIEQALAEVHTAMPGIVQAYDAATQRATVVPAVRYPNPQPDGSVEYEDLPPLAEVPVLFPRAGGFFVALPVAPGDTVLLVSQETAVGHWEAGDGGVSFPGDLRRHHLAHCVCIPGYYVRSQPLAHAPSPDAPALVLGSDAPGGPRLTLKANGDVILEGVSTVHLAGNPAADFVALAAKVSAELATIRAWANTHTHSGGAVGLPALAAAGSVAASKVKAT